MGDVFWSDGCKWWTTMALVGGGGGLQVAQRGSEVALVRRKDIESFLRACLDAYPEAKARIMAEGRRNHVEQTLLDDVGRLRESLRVERARADAAERDRDRYMRRVRVLEARMDRVRMEVG